MRPQYFDENDRQLLLDTYFADLDGASRQTLVRRIERFEATLTAATPPAATTRPAKTSPLADSVPGGLRHLPVFARDAHRQMAGLPCAMSADRDRIVSWIGWNDNVSDSGSGTGR